MGVIKMFSSCSDDSHQENMFEKVIDYPCYESKEKQKLNVVGNPNPSNFQIIRHKRIGHFVVALIKYPECLNFEGRKILVFENISMETIKNLNSIDPHFCNFDTHPSPIARFVPTHKGWKYAVQFCKMQC